MSTNIVNILNELATSLGRDLVLEACQKFAGSSASASASSAPHTEKKPKAERKPRGPSVWNVEVEKVLEEMRAAATGDAKITHKMAMEEASRRRRENNPEAQAKYEASLAKRTASKEDAKEAKEVKEAKDAKADEAPKKAGRPSSKGKEAKDTKEAKEAKDAKAD
jgi:hypothetical protein